MEFKRKRGYMVVRSARCTENVFVTFVNTTARDIGVYWMDFSGSAILYVYLQPRGAVEINTFRNHAWVFRDPTTGERFHVMGKEVYWAKPYFTPSPRNPDRITPCRKLVAVRFPMRTLRMNALWSVVRLLRNVPKEVEVDRAINECNLPNVIQDDVKAMLSDTIENFDDDSTRWVNNFLN